MSNRASRDSDKRDADVRLEWKNPNDLEVPEMPEGYEGRWIRREIRGEDDSKNVMKAFRQHWTPVTTEEMKSLHPDYISVDDVGSKSEGVIRQGDLILCKRPVEVGRQRREFYNKQADKLETAIKNQLFKDQNSKMPIYDDSKSGFSKGRQSFMDD